MGDLINNWPSWGETGSYPADGFFYDGGDQVNEKHMDALWNGLDVHISNLNSAIRTRVDELVGNVVLDQGLVASTGSGTREVDVSASNDGAYVDGEHTGSISATTLTHTANGSGSTRTDVVYVDKSGSVSKTEGSTTVPNNELKIAEVDVATDDTISAIRNYARDHTYAVASENTPSNPEPGDIWYDLQNQTFKVYKNGAFRKFLSEVDDVTINAGDGLQGGGTVNLDGGSTTLNIDVSDFAGDGLKDDGSENIDIEPADFAGAHLQDDGADNLEVNDGSGSGLDADTVDGIHASGFVQSGKFASERGTLSDGGFTEAKTFSVSFNNTYDPDATTAQAEIYPQSDTSVAIEALSYVESYDTDANGNITGMTVKAWSGYNQPYYITWDVTGVTV